MVCRCRIHRPIEVTSAIVKDPSYIPRIREEITVSEDLSINEFSDTDDDEEHGKFVRRLRDQIQALTRPVPSLPYTYR